jgi:hypothetical protein
VLILLVASRGLQSYNKSLSLSSPRFVGGVTRQKVDVYLQEADPVQAYPVGSCIVHLPGSTVTLYKLFQKTLLFHWKWGTNVVAASLPFFIKSGGTLGKGSPKQTRFFGNLD